jgi:hypothetical protein
MSLINSTPEYNLLEFEDYEKNDLVIGVIDDLKLFFQSSSCRCEKTKKDSHCFEKIGFKNFFERHFEFKSLDKKEKYLSIKTQLMVFQFSSENVTRHKYKYKYNENIQICKPVFLKLCDIKKDVLEALQKHLLTNGLEDRQHGNMKNIPKLKSRAFVDLEVAERVKNFILNYAELHGLPSPMRLQDNSDPVIYLETQYNYNSVFKEYEKCFEDNFADSSMQNIKYTTFWRLWNQLTPHIKFLNTSSDLCGTCETFRLKLKPSSNDANVEIKFNYEEHLAAANCERQHYNRIIEKCKNDLTSTHICYDWAQNVSAPYSPQQVGPIYFKTPFKINVFGICTQNDKGENYQLNYTIGEDELPEGTSKGANTTLNMVFDFLQKIHHGGKNLYVTCDNCSGQNKNNPSLWFWSWLIMLGWYENIYINFMIPGHTKFVCDGFFGSIKKTYRNRCINTVDHVEEAINDSTIKHNNKSIRYKNGMGWKWYDFSSLFKNNFRNLPNITKYHHFHFSRDYIGKVYVAKNSGGLEIPFELLKNDHFNKDGQLNIFEAAPLTDDRKSYLYTKIRQHVEDPFKDILCPEPSTY